MDEKNAWKGRLDSKLSSINAKTSEVETASASYQKTLKRVNVEKAKMNKIIAEMLADYTGKIKKYQLLIKDFEQQKNELNKSLTANNNDYLKIESYKN
jgi:predicted  nucleic acid-binding Zn-ribbon protein